MKKIKLLLVQPPVHPESITFGFMEPYALEVLAAAIKNHQILGHHVDIKIIDMRFGSLEKFLQSLEDVDIDFIGITGITIDVPQMIRLSKIFKHFFLGSKIILGGHHATMMPEDLFDKNVDFIVRGPGHVVLLRIIEQYLSGKGDYSKIKGVIQNVDGKFIECKGWAENIVSPPPGPMRNWTKRSYRCFGKPMSVVTTAQGCGSRCTFCACWPAMAGKYIAKSPEQVVAEIAFATEKYVFLGDDNTFGDIGRAWAIAKLLKKRAIKKFYDGYCRADIIAKHPDLLKFWSEIGLRWLTVGFEATSDQGLQDLHKNSSLETNRQANDILQSCGIVNYAHLLVRPDFLPEDFQATQNYVKEMGIVEPVFPMQTPLPGTPLWRQHQTELYRMPRQFFDLAHPLTRTALSIEEFYEEYLRLVGACFSFRRWSISTLKKFMNLVGGKFQENEIRTIALPVLMITLLMYKKGMTKEKIEAFVEAKAII